MDMSEYIESNFIRLDDVRGGPRRERITDCQPGNYNRPDLYFESGDVLGLNKTNAKILAKAYGLDSANWIGMEIELYVGEIKFGKENKEGVLVRPITPATSDGKLPPPAPKPKPEFDDFNDGIPF